MQLFTFSGTTVLLGLAGVCLMTALGILLLRRRLGSSYLHKPDDAGRRPDIFSLSPALHRYALCASLLIAFLTVNWTTYTASRTYSVLSETFEEISVEIPIVPPKPPAPLPPPPPPPVVKAVVDALAPTVEHRDQSVLEEDPVVVDEPFVPRPRKPVAPPPPVPPPPPVHTPEPPLLFVERMPVFGRDCQSLPLEQRKQCSDGKLLNFVQGKIRYPQLAQRNNIEGTVVLRFIVEMDGSVSGIEAVRKVAGGCTEEAVEALRSINTSGETFSPGLQAGRPVRVVFTLPVKFQLRH